MLMANKVGVITGATNGIGRACKPRAGLSEPETET